MYVCADAYTKLKFKLLITNNNFNLLVYHPQFLLVILITVHICCEILIKYQQMYNTRSKLLFDQELVLDSFLFSFSNYEVNDSKLLKKW